LRGVLHAWAVPHNLTHPISLAIQIRDKNVTTLTLVRTSPVRQPGPAVGLGLVEDLPVKPLDGGLTFPKRGCFRVHFVSSCMGTQDLDGGLPLRGMKAIHS